MIYYYYNYNYNSNYNSNYNIINQSNEYSIDINIIEADIENNLFKTVNLGKIWSYYKAIFLFSWIFSNKSLLINEIYDNPHVRTFLPILIINDLRYYPIIIKLPDNTNFIIKSRRDSYKCYKADNKTLLQTVLNLCINEKL